VDETVRVSTFISIQRYLTGLPAIARHSHMSILTIILL